MVDMVRVACRREMDESKSKNIQDTTESKLGPNKI